MNCIDGTTIKVTRGSDFSFGIKLEKPQLDENNQIKYSEDGNILTEPRYLEIGDVVIFSVKENFGENSALLRKRIEIQSVTDEVNIDLTKEDTTIGDLISEPVEYQYDVHLNNTEPIIVYDDAGPKIFKLYPEGDDDE